MPTDQTQVGQAWANQLPPAQSRTDQPDPRQRAVPAPTDRPQEAGPPADPKRRRWVAVWLTLAALLPAAWSATSFIDSDNLVIAGLAAIAPLVSVLALPVIAVGVASKHWVPTAIAVVAALLPWTLVTGYAAAGPGTHTVGDNRTLRVMAVDGAKGRASAQDIVQITRAYAVDVVVITELTSEQTHDLTVAGLNSLAPARWVEAPPGAVNGTGLWSRPVVEPPTLIPGLSQTGIDGVIQAGAARIGITVVHVPGEPLRPGKGWRSDLDLLASRPPPVKDSIIIGDLNAGPWQPAFRKLTGSNWRDAANVVGQGLRPTWPTWSPLPIAPVDHVLASPGLGVADAESTKIGGSNHRALIVTLVLPEQVGD
jgi:endonuclease/exonuclease/phosphatase (EEP) superfamily protein YafD